ncbi:MAG: PRC-barrel domain-containing protein [Candidatus Heimdallarchaeota archaeon]
MKLSELIGKTLFSKEGKKLGVVKQVEMLANEKEVLEAYLVIKKRKILRESILLFLPLKEYKIIDVNEKEIQINITVKEFEYLLKLEEAKAQRKISETKYAHFDLREKIKIDIYKLYDS